MRSIVTTLLIRKFEFQNLYIVNMYSLNYECIVAEEQKKLGYVVEAKKLLDENNEIFLLCRFYFMSNMKGLLVGNSFSL